MEKAAIPQNKRLVKRHSALQEKAYGKTLHCPHSFFILKLVFLFFLIFFLTFRGQLCTVAFSESRVKKVMEKAAGLFVPRTIKGA